MQIQSSKWGTDKNNNMIKNSSNAKDFSRPRRKKRNIDLSN